MIYHLHQYFCYLQKISIIQQKKKSNGRCRDVKTQKVCEQGREVNVEPKIKQTTSTIL